jgi:transposase
MHYAGVNLHCRTIVVEIEDEMGSVGKPVRFFCSDVLGLRQHFDRLRPFRAVVEASCVYRWLYDLLSPMGEVVLAHPGRLKAITSTRAIDL